MQLKVNNWLNIIQNKCLPPCCIFCGDAGFAGLDICRDCLAELSGNGNGCHRCGEHLESTSPAAQICGRCLSRSPAFDHTEAPYRYDDRLRYLITELKFNRRYAHARLLGELLARHLTLSGQRADCIVPVPLHAGRYRERGFNQSLEIARHVARRLDIELLTDACRRQRDTPHQTGLPAKQRRKNMRNAFSVSDKLAGLHVAVLDDVMTTGATAETLAAALKRSGVSRVDIWVCARA